MRGFPVSVLRLLPLVAAALLFAAGPAALRGETTVERITYHGWKDALRLRNEKVEAVVVPEIGRVMSFRLRDGENVFWEDRSLDGKAGDPTGRDWINFGGDKSWPAPEAEWSNYTKYGKWMPPPGFDGMPGTARIEGERVVLSSPTDPFYGIRTERRISLPPHAAAMTIETHYERVSGEPSKIGIWVITQFANPVAVFVPIPARSLFPQGHFVFREIPWPELTVADGLLRVTRDPRTSHKLGSDANQMLWVGEKTMCLLTSPRTHAIGMEYPDRGASAEVYTNPDPKKYVELETLGPLHRLGPGDRIWQTNTYTLHRRTPNLSPETEAKKLFGPAR